MITDIQNDKLNIFKDYTNIKPIFDFSINSLKSANADIDLINFTIIGSTLVKCSDLINHGKRLENLSWRIMGKNLVRYDDILATQSKGLDPQYVFDSLMSTLVSNNNNNVQKPAKRPLKSALKNDLESGKKLNHNDLACIAKIITVPSLNEELLRTKKPRKQIRVKRQMSGGKVPTLTNFNGKALVQIQNHTPHVQSLTSSQLQTSAQTQIQAQLQAQTQVSLQSQTQTQTHSQTQTQTQTWTQTQTHTQTQTQTQTQTKTQTHIQTKLNAHGQSQNSAQHFASLHTQSQAQVQAHPQAHLKSHPQQQFHSQNSTQTTQQTQNSISSNGTRASQRSKYSRSRSPPTFPKSSVKAVGTKSEINISNDKHGSNHSSLKSNKSSDKHSHLHKSNVRSLFRHKDKSSSGSILSDDDEDEDEEEEEDDDDNSNSETESDFEVYSDDEHPITKFKSNDSFTEKLKELKSQLGEEEKAKLGISENLGISKDGLSKHDHIFGAHTSEKGADVSNNDFNPLLKRQSTLFSKTNLDSSLYSDYSISEEDDELDYFERDSKGKEISSVHKRRPRNDSDDWTDDDDDAGSKSTNLKFTKSDIDLEKPNKKSLLSGLFLNQPKQAKPTISDDPKVKENELTETKHSQTHISKSPVSPHSDKKIKRTITFNNKGGLELDVDKPVGHYIGTPDSETETEEIKEEPTRPNLFKNKSELLLKSRSSNVSLSTYASLQPPVMANVTGTTSIASNEQNSVSSTQSIVSTLRKTSSTSSFSNLVQASYNFFSRSNSITEETASDANVSFFGTNTNSTARNRLKNDLLQKRSNAPATAKSLLHTAYSSHMFHQAPFENNANSKHNDSLKSIANLSVLNELNKERNGFRHKPEKAVEQIDQSSGQFAIDTYHDRGW